MKIDKQLVKKEIKQLKEEILEVEKKLEKEPENGELERYIDELRQEIEDKEIWL